MEEIYEQLPLIKENTGKLEGLRKFLEEKKLDNIYSSISEKWKNFIFLMELVRGLRGKVACARYGVGGTE